MNAHIFRRVAGVLSIALLSGCGSGSFAAAQPSNAGSTSVPSLALPSLQRVLAAAARTSPGAPLRQAPVKANSWMYTAQLYGNDSSVYERNGNALSWYENLYTGLSSPQGTMTTPNGWWYVANGGHSNVVYYKTTKSGPNGPRGSLDDYGQVPVNVSLTPDRRLVAVSNGQTTSGGPGSVSIYLNRGAEPSRTLTYGGDQLLGEGVALDARGNCYWSFNDSTTSSGTIVEFAGCVGSGTPVVSSIAYAGGILFDQRGNLYYLDQESGLYYCKKGVTQCSLFANGFGDPVNLNFDHRQKGLWVADADGYIWLVDPKSRQKTQYQAEGGPTDPPFGIAPAPGG